MKKFLVSTILILFAFGINAQSNKLSYTKNQIDSLLAKAGQSRTQAQAKQDAIDTLRNLELVNNPADQNYIVVETASGLKKSQIYNIPQESRIQQLQSLITQLQDRITLLEQALGDTTAPTVQIPNAPSNIIASSTEKNIIISWQDNSTNETGFEISRKVSALENWTVLDTLASNTTTYIDSLVQQGITYDYRVRALGSTGNSGYIVYYGVSLMQVNYAFRINPTSFYVEADSTGAGGGGGTQYILNAETGDLSTVSGWTQSIIYADSANYYVTSTNPISGSHSYRYSGHSATGVGTAEFQRHNPNSVFDDSLYIKFRLRIDTAYIGATATISLIYFGNGNYHFGPFALYRSPGAGNFNYFQYRGNNYSFSSVGYTIGNTADIKLYYYEGSSADSIAHWKIWINGTLIGNFNAKNSTTYGWGQIDNIRIGLIWAPSSELHLAYSIDDIIFSESDPDLSGSEGVAYTNSTIYLVNETDTTISLQTFNISPQNIFYTDSAQVASLPVNILPGDSLARTIKVLRSGVNGGSYSSTLYISSNKASQTYNLLGFIKTPNITPPDTTTPPTSGNIWYLSVTGSGTQDGKSRANARLYTNHSTLNIQPGDTVFFVQGIYNQKLSWTKSGSPAGLITLMPDPQNTSDAIFSNSTDYAIEFGGTSYIRLYKLKIRNSNGGILVGQGKVKYLDSLHISKVAGTGINIYGRVSSTGSYVYEPNFDPGHPTLGTNVDSVFIRWCYIATDSQVNVQTDNITIYWGHGIRIIGNYILQGNYTGDGHNDNIQTGHGLGDVYIANNMLINLKQNKSQLFMNGTSWGGYKTVIYNNIGVHYGDGTGMWQYAAYNGNSPTFFSDRKEGEVYLINNTVITRDYPFKYTPYWAEGNYAVDSLYAVNNILYVYDNAIYRPFVVSRNLSEPFHAHYSDNNLYATYDASATRQVIETFHLNLPAGKYTLSQWQAGTPFDDNSSWAKPTFRNFQYNSALYDQEDLRLTSNSVGVGAGRTDIKIKGNQWVNLKTLVESFGLQWEEFNNPYVSWATGGVRSELSPNIGACNVAP